MSHRSRCSFQHADPDICVCQDCIVKSICETPCDAYTAYSEYQANTLSKVYKKWMGDQSFPPDQLKFHAHKTGHYHWQYTGNKKQEVSLCEVDEELKRM